MVLYPQDLSQYEIIRTIGASKYTHVSFARCIPNGKNVALKQIDLEHCPFEFDQIRKTLNLWASLEHEHLVVYNGSFYNGSELYIILEYVDGGTLYDIMQYKTTNGFSDELLIASIIKEVLDFMAYFHRTFHANCTLKAKDILISSAGHVKINGIKNCSSYKNKTPAFCTKQQNDIKNIGLLAAELATGEQAASFSITKRVSPLFRDFISKCLNANPYKRPSVNDLLKHKFITQAKNKNYIHITLMLNLPPLDQRQQLKPCNVEAKEKNFPINFALDDCDDHLHRSNNDLLDLKAVESQPIKKGRFTIVMVGDRHAAFNSTSIVSDFQEKMLI